MPNMENFLSNMFQLGTGPSQVSNLIQGAQNGLGFKAGALDAATPLVMPPAVIVVLQTPTMWDHISGDEEGILRQTVKSMFECHAKSVTGIDIVYNVETQEQPIGHDGQNLQVPTRTTRQAVTPNFTWAEVTGNLVWNIIKRWMWDISDPDTCAGLTDSELAEGGAQPYTMSAYSITFMAIQYDKTMDADRILDAAVYTNVFPTNSGELGIERTLGTVKVPERSVPFTGYVIHNDRTRELGRSIAGDLALRQNYRNASPNTEVVSEKISGKPNANNGIIDDWTLANDNSGDDWTEKSGMTGS